MNLTNIEKRAAADILHQHRLGELALRESEINALDNAIAKTDNQQPLNERELANALTIINTH